MFTVTFLSYLLTSAIIVFNLPFENHWAFVRLNFCQNIFLPSAASVKHSVLEQIWIKGSYLDQRLPQHESRIEMPHIDFSKADFY